MSYRKVLTFVITMLLALGMIPSMAKAQVTPDPPTTPQPTVPCNPLDACGRAGGIQRDVGFAWIDRYCNGDAVPTPPGFTTFALNYGLGGQSLSPAQFHGTLFVNGVESPSNPLFLLQPGEKDTRIRQAIVPDNAIFAVEITGTSINTGLPLIFGNGTETRFREASGSCPAATPVVPTPVVPVAGPLPVPEIPVDGLFPPTL